MPAKLVTLDILKIKILWSKVYNVIIFVHDFSDKIFTRDSNYIVDVVMRPKFGNSSISMRKVIIKSIL